MSSSLSKIETIDTENESQIARLNSEEGITSKRKTMIRNCFGVGIFSFGYNFLITAEYVYFKQMYLFYIKKLKIIPFLISSLVYPVYAVTFGILSNTGGYRWKGRYYKN